MITILETDENTSLWIGLAYIIAVVVLHEFIFPMD
jgi:hypothetical protein